MVGAAVRWVIHLIHRIIIACGVVHVFTQTRGVTNTRDSSLRVDEVKPPTYLSCMPLSAQLRHLYVHFIICVVIALLLDPSVAMRRTLMVMQGDMKRVKFFYNDVYKVVLPESHRFPMEKYRMVREGLQKYFMADERVEFLPSPIASPAELKTTHCPKYVDRYLTGQMTDMEIRRVGFPWSMSNVQRSTSSVGGTVAAMRAVCEDECNVAGHCAGGTHHAFYNYGKYMSMNMSMSAKSPP